MAFFFKKHFNKATNTNLILDFDSTFITSEGLEELSKIALSQDPLKKEKIQKIQEITNLGMEGKIDFGTSLRKRVQLLKITKNNIKESVGVLKRKITPSIKENKKFIKNHGNQIYIISGGFREFVLPITQDFLIPNSHVFANNFVFNKKGVVVGVDEFNPLSKAQGKVKVVQSLNLKGKTIVVGDGYTDYQIKKAGVAEIFIAFTENVNRERVVEKADMVISNFDSLIDLLN